jgi:hypothetical protein
MLHFRYRGDSSLSISGVLLIAFTVATPALVAATVQVYSCAGPTSAFPVQLPIDSFFLSNESCLSGLTTVLQKWDANRSTRRSSFVHRKRQRKPLELFFKETCHLWLALFLLASGIEANPGPSIAKSRCSTSIPDCLPIDRSASTATFRCPLKCRDEWERSIQARYPSFTAPRNFQVCSNHFDETDYTRLNERTHRREGAVPSIFKTQQQSFSFIPAPLHDHNYQRNVRGLTAAPIIANDDISCDDVQGSPSLPVHGATPPESV